MRIILLNKSPLHLVICMVYTIEDIRERIIPIVVKYGIDSFSLFGSYARGEATESSDVDIRIDRGNSTKLRGLAVGGFYLDLKEALDRDIDLLTSLPDGSLADNFIANLRRDEIKIYENSN